MMIPDRSSEKVTIEDLLRIKRAERPSLEFWTRFEQDLRAKQLAAIVEKRPWWHALRLPQTARVIARLQVPAGAATVLALSFLVASHYYGRPSSPVETVTLSIPVQAPLVASAPPRVEHAEIVAALPTPEAPQPSEISAPKSMVSSAPVRAEVAANESGPSPQATDLTAMIPWGLSQADEEAAATQAPVSTRLIQTGLQLASTSDLDVTSLLANSKVDDNQIQPRRSPAAEVRPAVAQAASPRELRRDKILAGLVLAANADSPDYSRVMHGRDVAVNDLSEDQLYDSAHRLGVGGDRFTVKF